MLALGLMSGTSADGLSLALADFKGRNFRLLRFQTFAYPASLRRRLLRSASGEKIPVPEISRLNRTLGDFFAVKTLRFLKSARVSPRRVLVMGSHGHTVYHGSGDRPVNTLQIGEPSMLAEKTGIPVVSDFRQTDIAAGGQGAPLIPFFDQVFFGQGPVTACQNIGGIANVTFVGKTLTRPLAFDNGPGNCLMDFAVSQAFGSRFRFDAGGKFASKGKIDFSAVKHLLRHPYFSKKPPKSTGRELFGRNFMQPLLRKKISKYDLIATLTYFTAAAIAGSYRRFAPRGLKRVVISGGGAKNKTLMRHLRTLLNPVPVISIETLGIPAQAKEPAAFAYFAWCALRQKINHLPSGTGARGPRVLGKIQRKI